MRQLLFVRNSLGISQEALAQLLGVHRSTLKMVETGRRTLPREAYDRQLWMVNFLESLGEAGEEETFASATMEDLLLQLRREKQKADKEVEAMGTQFRQMLKRKIFDAAFLSRFPAENHPSEASRISAIDWEAQSFLTHRDEAVRLEMLARQIGLAAMVDWLEKKM